jgi:hypothetical protein
MLYSNENEKAGKHELALHSSNLNLSSGVYFLKMNTSEGMKVLKVIIK